MERKIYKKGTSHEKIEHYDLLILGAGPAGLTAAIYAGRYNLKTIVVAKSFGGTANLAGEIENWPGYFGPGLELMNKFKEQAKKFGATFLEGEVKDVLKDDNGFVLHLEGHEIHGKSLIIALGTEHIQLNVPGEKEFLGKGVSYCATCDGNFFRDKDVAVIGGADSAAKAAIYLSKICKKVHIIYRRHEMRCEPISLSKICNTKNIEIHYYSQPTEIKGENKVETMEIIQEWPDKEPTLVSISVDGVFIEIGATPVNKVVEKLGLKMEKDYIITNKKMETNIEGVFACGDVTDNFLKQVVTASAEGAIAVKSAHEWLMKKS
ncbi:MAG: FAD-dependent oxidoreductase [Candidatus Pacearchaeota archaeon]